MGCICLDKYYLLIHKSFSQYQECSYPCRPLCGGGAIAVFIISILSLTMYRYFDPKDNDSFLTSDPTYCSILRKLDVFAATLSIEDKALLTKLISECYHKHHKSIQTKSHNDIESFYSIIMALLMEQSKEIERLERIRD